jgi:hypothetical protein
MCVCLRLGGSSMRRGFAVVSVLDNCAALLLSARQSVPSFRRWPRLRQRSWSSSDLSFARHSGGSQQPQGWSSRAFNSEAGPRSSFRRRPGFQQRSWSSSLTLLCICRSSAGLPLACGERVTISPRHSREGGASNSEATPLVIPAKAGIQ